MSGSSSKQIVYLFGAGATHAELVNLEDDFSAQFEKKRGLLIKNVSGRVIERARRKKAFLSDIEMVSSAKGSLNIELLISLIENSRIKNSGRKTSDLKELVRRDIQAILTKSTVDGFYLHKTLLELHTMKQMKEEEELIGLVSLNYDDVLDKAYTSIFKELPNYSFSLSTNGQMGKLPLLKLHGSFNWDDISIDGKRRRLEIIPLGATKNYLHIPYNFIWSRALDLLIKCDILRVIGCSLSQNDIHLVDLLFKAHLEKGSAFEIQIIGPEDVGQQIQQTYGFFPEIKTLTQIEPPLVPDATSKNAFKTWLEYKGRKALKDNMKQTKYFKKIFS